MYTILSPRTVCLIEEMKDETGYEALYSEFGSAIVHITPEYSFALDELQQHKPPPPQHGHTYSLSNNKTFMCVRER